MANCRTGYKGAVFYMTKEKRGSEPELKLWDSPGTTKKYTKNGKTGQLDLLWGEERPLFDDWDNRMEQKTARARDCQSYSDLPVRRSSATQYEPSIRRRAAVQYEAPARRRPVPPAANRKRSCRRRTRLQKELQSIAVYIAALLFLVLAAFAVWKFVSISKNQSTETGAISRITQILEQKKCEKPPMEEALLTPNPYSRPQDALSTVTQLYVHYTANPGTSARQNRDYFEGLAQTGLTSASAHFVIGYEEPLSKPLNLTLERGQKIALTGANGIGKTTLIRSILGIVKPLKGSCELGENLQIGYFEQETAGENRSTCIEEIWNEFPSFTQYEVRSALAKCGLTTKHIESQIRVLSGGEQAKVRLCKLINRETNVLMLDEPTNHLDVDAKEELKRALNEYRGTLLLICHEPEFYQDIVQDVWDCSKWTTRIV